MKYLFILILAIFFSCGKDEAPPPDQPLSNIYFFDGVFDGERIKIEYNILESNSGNINPCHGPNELLEAEPLFQWTICAPHSFTNEEYGFRIASEAIPESQSSNVDIIKSKWPLGKHLVGPIRWHQPGIGVSLFSTGQDHYQKTGKTVTIKKIEA